MLPIMPRAITGPTVQTIEGPLQPKLLRLKRYQERH